jgi:CHAT domain-containing protein
MRTFYENWLGTDDGARHGAPGCRATKAEALRDAKQWLKSYTDEHGNQPYDHPFFWSAFILIGDSS